MEEIGLFPLGTVLLPTERVPLHIFEPRYRELISECVDEEREFGLVLADDDGLREVGTRAAVVEILERFDDGRLNVVVEGRERFRVRELTAGRSFQTAAVEPFDDEGPPPPDEAVERATELLRRVAELAGADPERIETSRLSPSFALAAQVELEPRLKQSLLELRSEPARLNALEKLLTRAARALEQQQARAEIASGNGHVSRERPV